MTNINIILLLTSGQCTFHPFGKNNAHISLTNTVNPHLCLSHSLVKSECLSVYLSIARRVSHHRVPHSFIANGRETVNNKITLTYLDIHTKLSAHMRKHTICTNVQTDTHSPGKWVTQSDLYDLKGTTPLCPVSKMSRYSLDSLGSEELAVGPGCWL